MRVLVQDTWIPNTQNSIQPKLLRQTLSRAKATASPRPGQPNCMSQLGWGSEISRFWALLGATMQPWQLRSSSLWARNVYNTNRGQGFSSVDLRHVPWPLSDQRFLCEADARTTMRTHRVFSMAPLLSATQGSICKGAKDLVAPGNPPVNFIPQL